LGIRAAPERTDDQTALTDRQRALRVCVNLVMTADTLQEWIVRVLHGCNGSPATDRDGICDELTSSEAEAILASKACGTG